MPHIFFRKPKTLPPIIGALNTFLLKKSGLVIQKPVTSANEKYNNLLRVRFKPIGAVKGDQDFSNADHVPAVKG